MRANPIRPAVPRPAGEGGRFARALARRRDRAALATLQHGEGFAGAPYASLVLAAFDLDGSPLLYLSDLAQHSKNLRADTRASLLFESGRPGADPLAAPRLTLLGEIRPVEEPRLHARFMARHPSNLPYAGFRDFRLYRMAVARAHLVAGFGRIAWIDGPEFLFAGGTGALAAAEAALVEELNRHYVAAAPGARRQGWQASGIDPEGVDLRREDKTARLDFAAPAASPEAVREALAQLAAKRRWRRRG